MGKRLIAKTSILYLAKMYSVGDEIPTNNPVMTKAWLEAGTAEWEGEEVETSPTEEETETPPAEEETETPPADEEPAPKAKRSAKK